jgi:hydroxypyruvate reductase
MHANRFATNSLRDPRLLRILSAALEAVDPYRAVKNHLPNLSGDIYGLGIGKAAIPMMDALAESIPLSGALAISKHASSSHSNLFPVLLGGHPIPDTRSVAAGERVLEFVSSLKENDTLVCLISGGGSALVTAPLIPLDNLQRLTASLLSCGATINEINTVRRHLDRIKGGGLVRATKAKVVSLILSDVIRNPLEVIASGMTVPDPTTNADAVKILEKYKLEDRVPISNLKSPFSLSFSRVQNIIIGDNQLAARAAAEQAKHEGFDAEILTSELQGEAREIGVMLANKLRDEATKRPRPFCLLAGGETTVTVAGSGRGGRNQELALAAVDELRGLENVILIALATDGEDGPASDAAGAVVTGESAGRAVSLGLSAADHLSRNDAYSFFESLEDLLKSGPTGTNVNDLVFLLAL